MAVSHVASQSNDALGRNNATSATDSSLGGVLSMPGSLAVGDYVVAVVLATPDVTAGTPIASVAGYDFIGSELADVDTLDTDLYLGVWGQTMTTSTPLAPTVSWSTGFSTSSSSISNARVSVLFAAFRGQADEPTVKTGNTDSTPGTPFTTAGYTLLRNSAAVTICAQRRVTAPTINTANGWTSHGTVTSGGLSRPLNFALKAGQTAGAMTMPTFTVGTAATDALASVTFDLPEVPVVFGAPGIYVDGAVHVA